MHIGLAVQQSQQTATTENKTTAVQEATTECCWELTDSLLLDFAAQALDSLVMFIASPAKDYVGTADSWTNTSHITKINCEHYIKK